ncbi:B12-binding domain-containing radical SAM protein [Vibrio parahaemolyticus]|uniref:B12-binding domain-containing radical SAM protein n=1 Tax=Vibrio parahaemolyticus TaxID=670 RepID=UPI00111E58B5|nr:radical SAM protein [Vibrio parahaemolyticus]TON25634.1 hypothetical protein CGH60_16635 [Vibrio parahaemolyticus]TON28481.1 hypothetical protein CGH60_10285 [Vibrio parahaemolyticus]
MKNKILLVPSLNIVNGQIEPFVPYGLLSLKAIALESENSDVDIASFTNTQLETTFRDSDEVVETFINSIDFEKYDVIGLSLVCNSAHYSIDLAKRIKEKNKKSIIIIGGPYVTKLSEQILDEYSFIDACFIGEAEKSFLSFIDRPNISSNPFDGVVGVVSRGKKYINAGVIDNLDELPDIFSMPEYYNWLSIVRDTVGTNYPAPIEATRGCPLKCSFCSTKQVWGPKVRRKSADRLIREMRKVSSVTGDDFFSFVGDNVGIPKNQFLKFCKELIELANDHKWGCSLKLNRFDLDDLSLMWLAGCRAMFIGLESASQETIDRIDKASLINREIDVTKAAIKLGFNVDTSFIIGFPWETEKDVRDTFELHCELLKLGAHRSQIGVLCPIPGTEIVSGYDVIFDGWSSYVAQDDVAMSDNHKYLVKSRPELYTHLGHYETPSVSKVILKAFSSAASQVSQLHQRNKNGSIKQK